MVIDHAESLIPGRFRHKFVRKKDQLLLDHCGSYFKALSTFLKTETSLIQKYMPDKIIEDVLKESSKDPRKTQETKAKVAKIKAKVTDAKAARNDKKETVYDKKASKERIGKCPSCNIFHYYQSRRGSSKGESLASAFLTACPKYTNATVEARATMIVDNKACAVCTDARHERSTCLFKRPKPCKETGCTANHHTMLHGSTNPKVMTIKMTLNEEDSEQFGLLPVIHYIFKEVNQGTTIFMDKGSNTSLITTKLANALYLKDKVQLTTILKACDNATQAQSCIHHEVTLQD